MAVYFVLDVTSGLIKIGRCHGDIRKRMASMRTSNPNGIKLIGIHIGADEADIQHRFASQRVFLEWFQSSVELRRFIRLHNDKEACVAPKDGNRRCSVCRRQAAKNSYRCHRCPKRLVSKTA